VLWCQEYCTNLYKLHVYKQIIRALVWASPSCDPDCSGTSCCEALIAISCSCVETAVDNVKLLLHTLMKCSMRICRPAHLKIATQLGCSIAKSNLACNGKERMCSDVIVGNCISHAFIGFKAPHADDLW